MADFRFVRALNGMTPQTELMTAGGAMEEGDIVVAGGDNNEGIATEVTKAADTVTRATIVGLCLGKHQEDGVAIASGDLVQVLPFHSGGIILEGTIKDATIPNVNTTVGIDVTSNVQTIEGAETDKVGVLYKIVDSTAKTGQIVITAV